MPPVGHRLKDLLDETRLVMLGAQLLLGVQYQAAFATGFARLPAPLRLLDALALLLILVAALLLLSTAAYHHIAEDGHASTPMLRRAAGNLHAALLPLALALGLDMLIAAGAVAAPWIAAALGAALTLAALVFWYALPMRAEPRLGRREPPMTDEKQPLEERIDNVLTELRVILPGAQALFGFQFAAVLTESFGQLPETSKAVHMASLGMVALAVVLLLAPAAYHRIAAHGGGDVRVLRYGVRMMLTAMALLAFGLSGEAYVTLRLVLGAAGAAAAISLGVLGGALGLFYVHPWLRRRSSGRRSS